MKNYIIIAFLFATVLITSCVEDLSVASPDFQVTQDSAVVKAGEEVVFLIDGNPDFMTFYSGEDGHRYEHRNRVKASGTPLLSFKNTMRWGVQQNTLQVMISTDLGSDIDAVSVGAATWTDITSSFTLDTNSGSWNYVDSGKGDLSAYADQLIYLAFRFTGTTGTTQRTWRITDFSVALTTEDNEVISIADISSPGFTGVDIAGEGRLWKWKSTYWEMSGGPGSAPTNEDWLVAGPINLTAVLPDKGAGQNAFTDKVSEIPYTYDSAGTYTATFVGINATVDDAKEVVREITIEVIKEK